MGADGRVGTRRLPMRKSAGFVDADRRIKLLD